MALRELFAPWFEELQRVTDLDAEPSTQELSDALRSGVLWVSWAPHRAIGGRGVDQFPTEAFELLALIAHVDRGAWLAIIAQLWPHPSHIWRRRFGAQIFELGVEIAVTTDMNLSRVCGQFLVGDSGLLGTDRYRRVRQHLHSTIASLGAQRSNSYVRVPVRIRLPTPENNEIDTDEPTLDASWVEVLHAASLQATGARRVAATVSYGYSMPSLFRLVEVKVDIGRTTWSTKPIACASQSLALGLPVSPVDLRGLDMIGETAPYLTSTLHQVLGVGDLTGTDSVVVKASYHVPQLDAIFSALLTSKSVRELQIDIDRTCLINESHRERVWSWIALVIFSGHATNGIQKITLDVTALNETDVATVRRHLEAPDPLSLLYPLKSPDRVGSACKFRLTCPPRVASTSHDIEAQPRTIVFNAPLHDLVVLDEEGLNSDWVTVVLPGWGPAWVASPDVVLTASHPRKAPKVRSNRELVLYGSQDREGVAVGQLLELVATQVHSLGLKWCEFRGTTLRRIFNNCPRLDEAKLDDMDLSYLHRIAGAYEDGRFRAQRVYLDLDRLLDEDETHQFFDHLADPRHPMTQNLRVLHITYKSRFWIPKIQTSVMKMLRQNRWLHEFKLKLEFRDEPDTDAVEEEELLLPAYLNYDGETIIPPLAPLQKLAFVSVVQSEDVAAIPNAVKAVDTNVLATIFQFAAEKHTRFVHVHYYGEEV